MPDREKVIKDLHDIAGFIAGRVGIEQARNFLRTIDGTVALLKEQEEKMEHLNNITLEYEKEVFRLQTLLKEQEETELCDRCGRRRLKSKRVEGR